MNFQIQLPSALESGYRHQIVDWLERTVEYLQTAELQESYSGGEIEENYIGDAIELTATPEDLNLLMEDKDLRNKLIGAIVYYLLTQNS